MKSPELSSQEIRSKFLDFFDRNGHTVIPSSSLIPAHDPTLLFANAGMNQFKDVFLGKEKRSYTRATSVQKCIRAGGKHNDLENVGFTKRHLTFFEMLGNFSFGDYFKKEAIQFAWDFLTKEVQLNPEHLYASVYKKDDEAYDIWHKTIGLPASKIVRLGEADNFWQMGDTGPCGPCSEIYVDRGTAFGGASFGCKAADCAPGCSCDRFLEIWNLVFMQFDRQPDGTDKPLKQNGVDTGMGLDRLCAIVQNKDSVYETDLFTGIIAQTEQLTGKKYATSDAQTKAAFHVLADHIRSTSFAIADGCSPSNEGRGYVLRKIIRRAALFAQKLSDTNFFPRLVQPLITTMGDAYPELIERKELIVSVLTSEIEKFTHNLTHGQILLEKLFAEDLAAKIIPGAHAFKLYDTYGFPLELTKVIAHERGFTVDTAGFEKEMEKQQVQSGKKNAAASEQITGLDEALTTVFTGYTQTQNSTKISALIENNASVSSAARGKTVWVITPESPLYVECGGQINDTATTAFGSVTAPITNIKKVNNAIAFEVSLPASLPVNVKVGDPVTITVNQEVRDNTRKNHTATHLLQSALLQVIGKTIKQSGSLVTPDYLRFDFTHHENLTPEQITKIEDLVNQKIMENIPVTTTVSTYADAVKQGVIAFFGDKYNPESVRVVAIPGFSAELCGGTHVRATGDIGCFKITEVSSLSAGNRRIIAVTGPKAVHEFQESFATVKTLCQNFKVQPPVLVDTIAKFQSSCKALQTQLKQTRTQLYKAMLPAWVSQLEMVGNVPFGFITLTDASAEELRDCMHSIMQAKPGVYIFISQLADRVVCCARIADEFANKLAIKDLAALLAQHGIKGGVSAHTLQGGGSAVSGDVKAKVVEWMKTLLRS